MTKMSFHILHFPDQQLERCLLYIETVTLEQLWTDVLPDANNDLAFLAMDPKLPGKNLRFMAAL